MGTTVTVDASGAYSVTFKNPNWTFSGNLGAPATSVATKTGSDKLDSYSETTFTYSASGTRSGRIRAYDHTPVVVFGESADASVSNTRNFPKLTKTPNLPYHITYGGPFIDYSMRNLNPDSPFIYFDASANAFVISAGSHFQNTQTSVSGTTITTGIQPNIATLPAGFETTTVLAAEPSINKAYQDWGAALTSFSGKTLVANDATPLLAKFGYWTDNGGPYHYATAPGMNYVQTLTGIKTYFEQTGGIPLAYMQLDSWWYPKGADQAWNDINGGTYLYQADPKVFPNGLAGFQQTIGPLPFVLHNRWIDASSPYRSQYKMSGNVCIDPAFWKKIATDIKAAGAITYEQDWLSVTGVANTNNLTDQDAYLDTMAQGMADQGLDIQYCMPWARHILQGSKYQNVTNSRVSDDRFERRLWRTFFYGSRLVYSVNIWPWSDVYMSTERDNMTLSLLTAGPFGACDALQKADFTAIKRGIRADGVIIKPDVPILLLDRSIVDEAKSSGGAAIATTYTQHAGGRFTYVFAFTDGSNVTSSFTPAELGYSGSVYAYNINADTGSAVSASQAVTATLASSTSTAYYMVAPVGPSKMALLGEKGKIAPMGKKRISSYSDDGTIAATVQFGTGEGPVTIQGYAPAAPTVTASAGTVGPVSYDSSTQRFTVQVTAAGTAATVKIAP